jgi:hypothetical protein
VPEQEEADLQPGEQPDDMSQTNDPVPLPVDSTADDLSTADQPVEAAGTLLPDAPVLLTEGNDLKEAVTQPRQDNPPLDAVSQLQEEPSREEPLFDQPMPVEQSEREKEPRRLSRAERETYQRLRRRFAACGRCGYFLADLQIYLGEEALQSAGLASRDDWLRLEGDETFRRLLASAYGVQLDIDYDYFNGTCPECRRSFVFAKSSDNLAHLQIGL